MISDFDRWLNESRSIVFDNALDTIIYYTLQCFSPDGGNIEASVFDQLLKLPASELPNPEIFKPDGPDIWVNCGDFNGRLTNELLIVAKHFYTVPRSKFHEEIVSRFSDHGMKIQSMIEDEVVVSINFSKDPGFGFSYDKVIVTSQLHEIVKFYFHTRPESLKVLKVKLKIPLTAKKFGI